MIVDTKLKQIDNEVAFIAYPSGLPLQVQINSAADATLCEHLSIVAITSPTVRSNRSIRKFHDNCIG
jgi:hypothetical protein